jgi:hypothetical protein
VYDPDEIPEINVPVPPVLQLYVIGETPPTKLEVIAPFD